ncbi:MAG: T9SS type A sorting domain-containing protein [bacterium]|nr:T9SS type A sorting domain-containing protein [bacterium]
MSIVTQGVPHPNRKIIVGDSMVFLLSDCRIEGAFATTGYYILLSGNSRLLISRCVFRGTVDFSSTLVRTQQIQEVQITNSTFVEYPRISGSWTMQLDADSVKLSNCYAKLPGRFAAITGRRWFQIEDSDFNQLCDNAFWMFAGTERASVVKNCRFDSLVSNTSGSGYLFSVNSALDMQGVVFDRCSFSNCQTQIVGETRGLIEGVAHRYTVFKNCIFQNNIMAGSPWLLLRSRGQIDSCQFINNQINGSFIGWVAPDTMRLQSCDFIGNHFSSFLQGNVIVMDAPNCFWGDTSGPQWRGNLNGLGLVLNDNVNPIPWHTTPVFPVNSMFPQEEIDRTHSKQINDVQCYPNPANGAFTIRYSIPPNVSGCSIRMYDNLGRIVLSKQIPSNLTGTQQIQFQNPKLASGVYYISFQSSFTRATSTKFVLLR